MGAHQCGDVRGTGLERSTMSPYAKGVLRVPEGGRGAMGGAEAIDHTSLSLLRSQWAELYLRARLSTRG